MTIEEICKALKDRNLKAVALATGLSPHTLYRMVRGDVTPHIATQQLIANYLKASHGWFKQYFWRAVGIAYP